MVVYGLEAPAGSVLKLRLLGSWSQAPLGDGPPAPEVEPLRSQ